MVAADWGIPPRASATTSSSAGQPDVAGGDEYEPVVVEGRMVLQLHLLEEAHHHGVLARPGVPLGNGVVVWFEEMDAAIERIRKAGATIVTDLHVNPNAGHREIWLRDLDGYLVVLAGR
jgi:predicted enzyme related to lactoylglutathione lyase